MFDLEIAILLPLDLWLFGNIVIIVFRDFIDLFKNGHEMGDYIHQRPKDPEWFLRVIGEK